MRVKEGSLGAPHVDIMDEPPYFLADVGPVNGGAFHSIESFLPVQLESSPGGSPCGSARSWDSIGDLLPVGLTQYPPYLAGWLISPGQQRPR